MGKQLTLELSDEAVVRFDIVRKKSCIKNNAELIRNAMQLYEWALDEKARGFLIGSVDQDRVLYTINFTGGGTLEPEKSDVT